MNPVELVVSDMAGTTVEDSGEVYGAFETALQTVGIRFSEDEIRTSMGASKREVFRYLVERECGPACDNDSRVEELYQDFVRILNERFAFGARAISGVGEVFSKLRERNVKIALTTGFGRETQQPLLSALGWEEGVVDAAVCADDVLLGRPAPYMIFRAMEMTSVVDVSRVLVVGDTSLDLEAGSNAGAGMVVGVLSGVHGVGQLGGVRHSHIIERFTDLPTLLEATT